MEESRKRERTAEKGNNPSGRYVPAHPFVAGALAGGVEILITFPLEYVKVQLQLQDDIPGSRPEARSAGGAATAADAPAAVGRAGAERRSMGLGTEPQIHYKGPLHVARSTLAARGFTGLYVGLPAWLSFALPRTAIKFSTYEAVTSALQGGSRERVSGINAALAGTVAGAVEAATCLTPLQSIQIKMTHDLRLERKYKGFFHACVSIPRQEGIAKGLFCGLVPCVAKGALNNAIRFCVVGELSALLKKRRGGQHGDSESLGLATTFGVGVVAGAMSAVVTHPIDTVKSNMQGLEASRYSSSFDCARQIMSSRGLQGLYRGLSPRCGRVCLEIGLHFALYDQFSRALDRWLDG